MEYIERHVLENIEDPMVLNALQELLFRLENAPHLKRFLLKSFISFPHYSQVIKEAKVSARNVGKFHYKLENLILVEFIDSQIKETERHVGREARECFRIFTARLLFSKVYKNVLEMDAYREVERYVIKTQQKT